jgi:selenide,water dikinase
MKEETAQVRLTQTVQKGGCAAKVAATELRQILKQVRFPPAAAEVLVDSGSFDDAGIYKISDSLALVQTLDFFTPIVDSPYLFGKIAAANALSDVYAMGGKPITAMAIFAFPVGALDNQVAVQILQGASDVIAESGASLVGGHTIDDDTIKFGLTVTGTVNPRLIWTNANAQVDDALILTKGLGTGALTAALKRGAATEMQIQEGLDSMCKLNSISNSLTPQLLEAIHAATDITGFGLGGHSLNLAKASEVTLEIELKKLPLLPHALNFIEQGFLTKAHRTNMEYIAETTSFENATELQKKIVVDPQTSGGLLLSVNPIHAAEILQALQINFSAAQIIGRVALLQSKLVRYL